MSEKVISQTKDSDNLMDKLTYSISRREFLSRMGVAFSAISVSSLLSGCIPSDEEMCRPS